MNIKSIIVGSLAVGLAIGGTLFNSSLNTETESVYTPRTLNNGGLYGNAGRAAHRHSMLADLNTGQIDMNLVEQARLEVMKRSKSQNSKALLGMNWYDAGPDNQGGRTRAVLVDKNNSNTVYAGSVAGGLFVSYDGANTWSPVAGLEGILGESLIISGLTQTANGRIFFSTGCTFEGGTGPFPGNGIYEYVPSSGAVLPVLTGATVPTLGGQFQDMNCINSKGNRLYIGFTDGFRWADPDGNGFYPTTLGGWFNPLENQVSLPETGTCQDIDVAADGSLIVVSFSGKHYISANGNDGLGDFTLTTGVTGGRMSCAVAPSNSSVIYRMRTSGILISLDISTDRGQTWNVIVPGGGSNNYCLDPFRQNDCTPSGQGGYDDAIAVDPNNWGHILVGGVQMFEWIYNPGSNPIGGSWLKSANLVESSTNPYYVHADKHWIEWLPNGVVYCGTDGGVFKSSDNGTTWQEKNFGYNTCTFYDMSINALGWMIGGAQDNGCQMWADGLFGGSTPWATFEVNGGDGCAVEFSNQGPGIVFSSSQNGAMLRTAGGTPGAWVDPNIVNASAHFVTTFELWESNYDPMSVDSVEVVIDTNNTNGVLLVDAFDLNVPRAKIYMPGDTLMPNDTLIYNSLTNDAEIYHVFPGPMKILANPDTLVLQDYIQNKFVVKANDGIYLTRDATRLNTLTPEWFKISSLTNVNAFQFSPDGNHLFVGTSSGVTRISGLSMANDSLLDIGTAGNVISQTNITGTSGGGNYNIGVDPNDGNNVILTKTGYVTGTHVFRSTNALGASPSATGVQGAFTPLPAMPVYDAMIDMNDNDKVILATDWGVWSSDNAFSATPANVEWNDESGNGFCHVPTYRIMQNTTLNMPTTGYVFLGTYGRGFYRSATLFTGVEDEDGFLDANDDDFVSNLLVYPNPVNNAGTISFDLNQASNASINIFNLNGKLVKSMSLGKKQQGAHKVRFDANELSVGTYIVSLTTDKETSVAKFIVSR